MGVFRRGIATTLLVVSSGCSTVADHGDSTLDAPPSAPALEVPPARDAEQTPPLRPIDPNARFEGDIKVPRGTWGAGIAGKRWPNRTVPYALAPGFPYEERVRDAIAHWQSKTVLRFVPRTNETDYVRFVAGHGCAAHVGRQGGAQEVELAAGEHVSSLVGVDFSPADGKAHYFWWSGYRSVGRSSDPDEHETLTRFAVAAGKTPSMILDVAFAPNGQVYAWYRDGTYSIGTPADLGATQAAQPFTTPSGRRASDIVGVAIAANGHVLAWYADGTFSEGTASSLASHAAPQPYALPAGRTRSELLGFGVANDGHVHAWYSSGKASAGTSADLGSFRAPFAVAWMGPLRGPPDHPRDRACGRPVPRAVAARP
ncbi:MAG: hypothetical protein JST00_34160 [Deltaproteobacteria bacterium]|nr:hypothetical protein [Deltaproteobacteria bacterium]